MSPPSPDSARINCGHSATTWHTCGSLGRFTVLVVRSRRPVQGLCHAADGRLRGLDRAVENICAGMQVRGVWHSLVCGSLGGRSKVGSREKKNQDRESFHALSLPSTIFCSPCGRRFPLSTDVVSPCCHAAPRRRPNLCYLYLLIVPTWVAPGWSSRVGDSL